MNCLRSLASLAAVVLLSACTSSAAATAPAATDPVFAGLDSNTVVEVLASPTARDRIDGDSEADAKARLQNIVRNFYACRSALQVYQGWVKTGTAPAFPAQPTPTNPAAWADDENRDIAGLKRDATSGDITLLRTELTRADGCGSWIPAKPGDVSGPTIADAVRTAK